jgi:hypothetical protein
MFLTVKAKVLFEKYGINVVFDKKHYNQVTIRWPFIIF